MLLNRCVPSVVPVRVLRVQLRWATSTKNLRRASRIRLYARSPREWARARLRCAMCLSTQFSWLLAPMSTETIRVSAFRGRVQTWPKSSLHARLFSQALSRTVKERIPLSLWLIVPFAFLLAQVIIRWHLQRGVTVIPKSVTESRILANKVPRMSLL